MKIRISENSESKKRLSTALPKDPVPPVISSTLFLNILKTSHENELTKLSHFSNHFFP